VLARASYSIANGKSAIIRLEVTAAGLTTFANAKARPVKEHLSVTLKGRRGQSETLLIS